MVGRTITSVALLAATAIVFASGCQRARVDLNRPCDNDGDCVGDFICNGGFCTDPNDPSCVASAEVCDGLDNDCDGDTDEGFECVLGGSESCGADGALRLCKSDCTLSACVTGWLDGAWPHRLLVTISGARVTSDVADAVVPLRIPAASLGDGSVSLTTPDGSDVRITDLAGNLLAHQVESWDAARGFVVWVALSKLRMGEDRGVYLYVGNTHTADASTRDIWDAGYVGVWHMADDVERPSLVDASAKQNDASGFTTSPSAAVFGSGQHYAGDSGAFAEKAGVEAGADLTIEGWFIPQQAAQPYRRTLTVNAPVSDVQVLWPVPNDLAFEVHTAPDYARLRVAGTTGLVPHTVLLTDHGTELWVRVPQAGSQTLALVYGQDGLADGSDGAATFPFWAADGAWATLFAPAPTASAGPTVNGFGVTSGRLAAQLPVDMRDGYFVQTYANYTQSPGASETRQSGSLPFVSSSPTPTTTLPGVSSVWVTRNPGLGGGGMRTSTGAGTGFDQGTNQDVPFLTNDIGIGTNNNTASVFVDQVLGRQIACAWANPLQYLVLGAYDGTASFYPTNYIVMFVRRWPGMTPLISATRERVGGFGIGDFAISAQPDRIYSSTNAGSNFATVSAGPLAPHHVALVVQGGEAIFYIDGEETYSLPANGHGPLQGFAVGDAFAVNGTVDEVRLSSTARSRESFELQVNAARNDFITVSAPETLE